MTERAAHLVDHVIPDVPVRQWVLTLPHRIRYLLAWRHDLCRAVVHVLLREVYRHQRTRARERGLVDGRTGAVAIVQRFGGALNLNVHIHALVLDGVFARGDDGRLRFHPAPELDAADVADVLAAIAPGVQRLVARHGGGPDDPSGSDAFADASPLLAGLAAASVQGGVALGGPQGARPRRVGPSFVERSVPDANFKPIVDAPSLPADAEPPPQWVREMLAEWNDASTEPPSAEALEQMQPRIAPEHLPIRDRAYAYAAGAHCWLRTQTRGRADVDEACDVIDWFAILIAAKINRSLQTWPDRNPGNVRDDDSAGSAKIALITIERSHAACLTLVEREFVTASEADPFLADLVWLGDALERARPHARAFVRPGLESPRRLPDSGPEGTTDTPLDTARRTFERWRLVYYRRNRQ